MTRTGIFVVLALTLFAADLNAQILGRGRRSRNSSSATYVQPMYGSTYVTPAYYGSPMMTTGTVTTTDGTVVMSPTMYGTPTLGTTTGTPTVTGGTIVSGSTMTTPMVVGSTPMYGSIVGTYPTTMTPGYSGMMVPTTTTGYGPVMNYPAAPATGGFFNRVGTGRMTYPMAVSPGGGYYYIR